MRLVGEFTEVETGKGANALAKRPQLRQAIAYAKRHKAVLLIAKLDRLARNTHFVTGLMETGVDFLALDMPYADKLMIHIHAAFAEHERDEISKRTKTALAAAKARGTKLGNPHKGNAAWRQQTEEWDNKLWGILSPLFARGMTQRAIADELNRQGVKTRTGESYWSQTQVKRVWQRIRARGLLDD